VCDYNQRKIQFNPTVLKGMGRGDDCVGTVATKSVVRRREGSSTFVFGVCSIIILNMYALC